MSQLRSHWRSLNFPPFAKWRLQRRNWNAIMNAYENKSNQSNSNE